jgi:hypothetical protein
VRDTPAAAIATPTLDQRITQEIERLNPQWVQDHRAMNHVLRSLIAQKSECEGMVQQLSALKMSLDEFLQRLSQYGAGLSVEVLEFQRLFVGYLGSSLCSHVRL